jgi:hypothetical protein
MQDNRRMNDEELNELIERRLDARAMCVSLHEAGHAMLADALNVAISRASIEGLEDKATTPMAVVELVPDYPVCHAIVIALAGQAVDETLIVDPPCESNWLMYRTDEDRLSECLIAAHSQGGCTPEQSAHYWRNVPLLRRQWVATWVATHAEAITAFARRLKECKVLTGAELAQALEESWADTKPDLAALLTDVQTQVNNSLFVVPTLKSTDNPRKTRCQNT